MLTLAGPNRHEQEVKRSRFIALVARADSPDEALAFLESVRDADATHNCWAYKIGELYRFSDDGEPGGSAGRPILAAIEGQGLDHAVAVVTRFFGGTKLGVGGLVRAYGGTAAECLRTAPKIEVLPEVRLDLFVPFDVMGAIYPILERYDAKKVEERYIADGLVLTVDIGEAARPAFESALRDATRGKARVTATGQE